MIKRRDFLRDASLVGASLGTNLLGAPTRANSLNPPNILIILVDQMRYPVWFPAQDILDTYLPNIARIRTQAVQFGQHYTAATACTAARASLLTGLYAHQHYCVLNAPKGNLVLNPGFPTYGTLIQGLGLNYTTWYYGKFHVADANHYSVSTYGFNGGTYPDPFGSTNGGLNKDSGITDQFINWFTTKGKTSTQPWCMTVSFINPHDIAFYPNNIASTEQLINQTLGVPSPSELFTQLPGNYETATQMANDKPGLPNTFVQGSLPHGVAGSPNNDEPWLTLLDDYLQLQQCVDIQIGRVLDTLNSDPAIASNTIIIFTSDHGEYGGSHSLHGKGRAAYDEAIRVPLYVQDPTGIWATQLTQERQGMTSSVDIVPLVLTLASGNNNWRGLPGYQHLAGRYDLAAMLRDATDPGRPYIFHTWDESPLSHPSPQFQGQFVPFHVIGFRQVANKLVDYSFWQTGTVNRQVTGYQTEVYDYSTSAGRLETNNIAGTNPTLTQSLYQAFNTAVATELHQPLPSALQPARQIAIQALLSS